MPTINYEQEAKRIIDLLKKNWWLLAILGSLIAFGGRIQAIASAPQYAKQANESVEKRVLEIVAEYAKEARGYEKEISRQTSLTDDVGCDAIDCVALTMELEHEFDMAIPDAVVDAPKTVGDIVDYIKQLQP